MEFQDLCELAEKELSLGMADEQLLERAFAEANGIEAIARQIYWRLRATSLQNEAKQKSSDKQIIELRGLLETQEKRERMRKERYRWFWAITCFASIVCTFVFPRLAMSVYARGGYLFYGFAVLGVACLCLAIFAFRASNYHTNTE